MAHSPPGGGGFQSEAPDHLAVRAGDEAEKAVGGIGEPLSPSLPRRKRKLHRSGHRLWAGEDPVKRFVTLRFDVSDGYFFDAIL
jgi:hypothetical protein